MRSINFIKRIKNYAIASFLVPLIAINSCLLIYKLLGNITTFPNFNWEKEKIEFTLNEYYRATNPSLGAINTFTNCPKNLPLTHYITYDDQTILNEWYSDENRTLINSLLANQKIKSVTFKKGKNLNNRCVKKYQFSYSLLKKFSSLETALLRGYQNNSTGFAKIRNPYLYGEVSISRTARYFPAILIFKTLIILSAFLLLLYWKNNLNLFSELKNNNTLIKFSKKFFYLGVFSCIFLILHATFLGLDIDSKLFSKTRRLIIILFIFFEILAQIHLTKNLFKFREELSKYINPLILKLKIIFVAIMFVATCVALVILVIGDPSTAFKHILEWNYFSFLLLYYLLSRLLWKR